MERERTIQQMLDLLAQLYQAIRRIARGEWLNIDLTTQQVRVMLVLFTDGPTRMGVLATQLGTTLSTATGIVDRLIERSLVERESDPRDRRVVLCRLSGEGHKLVSRLWELGESQTRQLLEAMTPEELGFVDGAARAFLRVVSEARPHCGLPSSATEEV